MSRLNKTEAAVQQMEKWAADDAHGYDQIYRWGQKGDFDCSAAVIQAWENAGVPVKVKGATYTGNMYSVFIACGFKDITSAVDLKTGNGLKRGDVLLNHRDHTAMYCGSGMEVEASINEKGTATGGVPGDQTGREFLKRTYRNFPWNAVLRYTETEKTTAVNVEKSPVILSELSKGIKGVQVVMMQSALIYHGYSCGLSGADGDFGNDTEAAVRLFQFDHGLIVDGICGINTWTQLVEQCLANL